ncbi:MAG: type IV toxin-antitoxin system AbiEi family antitoxin domain-containing protein [Ornithinimicrobium sp.]|uniref:type IV toxin-antitoxin system AbiEi family antitoxin domain-containing protein n=1 Tax=Ornithinimicrobium sp. TaxID=1977084 RepID=UPI003D9BA4B9
MTFDPTHLPLVTLGRVRPTGVFTLAEAAASGVHRHDLGQWATRGVITRVAPGAFVTGGRWQAASPERRLVLRAQAASLRLLAPALLSHSAAAALHGLPLVCSPSGIPCLRLHLTRGDGGPSHTTRRHTLHRRYGTDQRAVPVDGVAAVLPVLAAFGVAEADGMVAGVVALDAALHQGKTTLEEAQAWLARLPRRPGTAVIRRVIHAADGLSESPLESRARLVVSALGHQMRLQVRLVAPDGAFVARVDGLIEELGVVIEVDGRVKYVGSDGSGSVEAVMSEKHRESAICDLGYGIVRLAHAGLSDPAQLDVRIQAAARRAHPRVCRPPQPEG